MRNATGVTVYVGSYVAVAATTWALYQEGLLGTWFLIVVFAAATALSQLLSVVWPRESFREDKSAVLSHVPHVVLAFSSNHFIVRPLSLLIAWHLTNLVPVSFRNLWIQALNDAPPIVLLIVCLIFYEALGYVQHRVFHAVPLLWRISHSIHHEPASYGPSLALRVHYLEYFTLQITRLLILTFLNIDPLLILAMVSISVWGPVMHHANTCLKFGWINYIVATPETHIWHHDQEKRVNYSVGIFSIFDWLGGTFCYRPQQEPVQLGAKGATRLRSLYDIVLCRPYD